VTAPAVTRLLTDQVRDLIPAALAGLVEEFAHGAKDIQRLWAAEDFDSAYEEWDAPEPFRECFTMAADFAAFCTAAGLDAWRVRIESQHPYTDLHAVTADGCRSATDTTCSTSTSPPSSSGTSRPSPTRTGRAAPTRTTSAPAPTRSAAR